MSGTLTQAPNRRTTHRPAAHGTSFSDHLTHIPHAPRGTTPNILRAAAAAAGVLALIAAVVLTSAASGAQSRISTVGGTDAPSVRATNDFLFKLQDMDAQLVNALLVNGDTSVHVPRTTSVALLTKDREDANQDLESATAALAGNASALSALHDVADSFSDYQAQATRTLADDERDGGTTAGVTPPTVFADYLAADDILFGQDGKGGLAASAKALEQSSRDAIDSAAGSTTSSLNVTITEFLIFGALLAGGLVALQMYLYRRFHRLVNPALIGATVVALIIMIGGAAGVNAAEDDFHTAKAGAFDSVLALGEANALSAGMNADESRWLLAHDQPAERGEFEASYVQAAKQVAKTVDAQNATEYDGSLGDPDDEVLKARAAGDLSPDTLANTVLTPDSAFGREFRNITFDGEADAAATAFQDYCAYLLDDSILRQMTLNTPEEVKTAINADTDTAAGSDHAFTIYSNALGDVVTINETQFESSMPAAKNGIGTWTWLPYLLSLLLIGLTVLGLRPRLTEYR